MPYAPDTKPSAVSVCEPSSSLPALPDTAVIWIVQPAWGKEMVSIQSNQMTQLETFLLAALYCPIQIN